MGARKNKRYQDLEVQGDLRIGPDDPMEYGTLIVRGDLTGVYDRELKVHEFIAVEGDMNCGDVTCAGSITAQGEIECSYIQCDGAIETQGNMKCADITCAKSITAKGDMECYDIQCGGAIKVQGDMVCENIHGKGNISVQGNMDCADIYCSKRVTIKGNFIHRGVIHCEKGLMIAGNVDSVANCEEDDDY